MKNINSSKNDSSIKKTNEKRMSNYLSSRCIIATVLIIIILFALEFSVFVHFSNFNLFFDTSTIVSTQLPKDDVEITKNSNINVQKSSNDDPVYHEFIPYVDNMNRSEYKKLSDWYFKTYNFWTNGADFDVIRHLFTAICQYQINYFESENENESENRVDKIVAFDVGANYGTAMLNILQHIPMCQSIELVNKLNITIYGFEAIPPIYEKLQKTLFPRFNNHAFLFNYAISNNDFEKINVTSDLQGTGGIHPNWHKHDTFSYTVETRTFSSFSKEYLLNYIDFTQIDVEGHEIEVILGMNLTKNYQKFPMIQVELGGTWTDTRHTKFEWTMGDLLRYLQNCHYHIYIMGVVSISIPNINDTYPYIGKMYKVLDQKYLVDENGYPYLFRREKYNVFIPILLPIYPSMVDNTRKLYRGFAQGNILAIHWKSIKKEIKPSLKYIVNKLTNTSYQMMKNDSKQLPEIPHFVHTNDLE